MLVIAPFIVLISGLQGFAPGLTAPGLLQRAVIPPLASPLPWVQPTLDLAHTDAIGRPHEPNLVWGQSEMRRASPGTLGEGCFNGFFVLCILSFLVLPPLSSFTRRNNEVVSFRLITRENLFTWSYQWSVRLSIALPVIQERKSITGESDQYQHPLYLQKDLRKNHPDEGTLQCCACCPHLYLPLTSIESGWNDPWCSTSGGRCHNPETVWKPGMMPKTVGNRNSWK